MTSMSGSANSAITSRCSVGWPTTMTCSGLVSAAKSPPSWEMATSDWAKKRAASGCTWWNGVGAVGSAMVGTCSSPGTSRASSPAMTRVLRVRSTSTAPWSAYPREPASAPGPTRRGAPTGSGSCSGTSGVSRATLMWTWGVAKEAAWTSSSDCTCCVSA